MRLTALRAAGQEIRGALRGEGTDPRKEMAALAAGALSHPEAEVRLAAVHSACRLRLVAACPRLADLAQGDPDLAVRQAAAEGLSFAQACGTCGAWNPTNMPMCGECLTLKAGVDWSVRVTAPLLRLATVLLGGQARRDHQSARGALMAGFIVGLGLKMFGALGLGKAIVVAVLVAAAVFEMGRMLVARTHPDGSRRTGSGGGGAK